MGRKTRKAILLAAGLYGVLLVYLLFCRQPKKPEDGYPQELLRHLNLIPFGTIRRYLWVLRHSDSAALLRHAAANLFGNIALFLPLGIFPPLLNRHMRRLWKNILLATGLMISAEILQALLLVGTCDVDDVLLNVLGAAIGYGIFRLCSKNEVK